MRECRDLLTPVPIQIIFAIPDGVFSFFYPQDINENYYLTTYNSLATKQSALGLSNYRLDYPIRPHCWITYFGGQPAVKTLLLAVKILTGLNCS